MLFIYHRSQDCVEYFLQKIFGGLAQKPSKAMQTVKIEDTVTDRLVEAYFGAVRYGNAQAANEVALAAIAQGMNPVALAVDVFTPALTRIGTMWHQGEVNVAVEHLATQITFSLIERLRPHIKRRTPIGQRAVITTVEGEVHSLGARLAAEALYQDGWDADYLGADTPIEDLVDFTRQREASLVVLSVSLNDNLIRASEEVGALKSMEPRPFIVVGGPASETPAGERYLSGADALVNDLKLLPVTARSLIGRPAGDTLEDYLLTIGVRVQELRRKRGWSQHDLAAAADLDRTYISGVERGKQNLSMGVLLRLANALGTSLESMLPNGG